MPRKADRERFDFLHQLGCICCLLEGHYRWADVHHLTEGGYRDSHQETISLCPYHHRGVGGERLSGAYGPSLALSKRQFENRYVSERFLLDLVNHAYDRYLENTFNGVPALLRRELRDLWSAKRS